MSTAFSHDALVNLAGQWLARRGNVVVITELSSAAGETPDALGFDGAGSTVIECKTSRSDFKADAQKCFRHEAWRGMGQKRYYMAPKDLLKLEDLPDGWGLIEISDTGKARCIRDVGAYFEKNADAEIKLLISALRRVGQTTPQGVSVKCYTIQTQCKATLGVAEIEQGETNATTDTAAGEVQE